MMKVITLLIVLSGIALIVALNLFRYDRPMEVGPLVAEARSDRSALVPDDTGSIESVEELAALQFVQTFSRPLFSETRKKFVKPKPVQKKKPAPKPAPVKKAAPPTPPPKIKILGISMSNGVKRTLVKLPKIPTAQWLEAGANINGWELVEITSDSVKLANASREISIALFPQTQ